MASLIHDPNGSKRLQFFGTDGKRKTIRLGKCNDRQAVGLREKIDALLFEAKGGATDMELSRWVAGLDDTMHSRLANAGLVKPRLAATRATLVDFIDNFIERQRTCNKPQTLLSLKQVRRWLVKFFSTTRDMPTITAADAEDFRTFMATEGLGDNTARRHIGRCRQIFRAAIRRGVVLSNNPFEGIAATVHSDKSRQFFVTREMAQKLSDACPDAQWRVLVALSRFGGLRIPSEALPLRWADVDWDNKRILVTSPKTEQHEGKASRVIPLFAELRKPLLEAYEAAEDGSEFVITRYRAKYGNLRTHLIRLIQRAGLKPWPKPWHNMRATRQTELAEDWPLHVVCAWIGNSRAIAQEHYLQVTDDHFKRASIDPVDAAQNAAQHCMETPCTAPHGPHNNAAFSGEFRSVRVGASQLEAEAGFEPANN